MWHLGPCSAAPSSGPMMTRPGGRSNRSVAPADSAGVACGAADARGPTRGSRGSRRIRRERCSEGASCCDADGCSRASVCAPQRRSRCALARRGQLGAPPTRAGARGGAWLGTNRAHGIERTARPAGAWAHTRADRHVIRASLAKRALRSQAAKGGEGRRGLRARAREGVKRARRVLVRAAGRLLAARGRAA